MVKWPLIRQERGGGGLAAVLAVVLTARPVVRRSRWCRARFYTSVVIADSDGPGQTDSGARRELASAAGAQ
jgi:hypothetical protein